MKKVLTIALLIFFMSVSVSFAGTGYFALWEESGADAARTFHTNIFVGNVSGGTNTVTITAYRMDGLASVTTWKALSANQHWTALGARWITGTGFDEGSGTSNYAFDASTGANQYFYGQGKIEGSASNGTIAFVDVYCTSLGTGFDVPVTNTVTSGSNGTGLF